MFDTARARWSYLQHTFGAEGHATTLKGWTEELKTTYNKARQWRDGRMPRGQAREIEGCFANVARIREAGLSPSEVTAWFLCNTGPVPVPAGTPPPAPGGSRIVAESIHAADLARLSGADQPRRRAVAAAGGGGSRVTRKEVREGLGQIIVLADFVSSPDPLSKAAVDKIKERAADQLSRLSGEDDSYLLKRLLLQTA